MSFERPLKNKITLPYRYGYEYLFAYRQRHPTTGQVDNFTIEFKKNYADNYEGPRQVEIPVPCCLNDAQFVVQIRYFTFDHFMKRDGWTAACDNSMRKTDFDILLEFSGF